MEVSLDLLLESFQRIEWLQVAGSNVTVMDYAAKIKSISLLSTNGEALAQDVLWCGYVSNILALEKSVRENRCFIGFGTTQEFQALSRLNDCNCILFAVHVGLPAVFNEISEILACLHRWEHRLELWIARHESLQTLVDICDEIMINPLIIWNASFEILAYSRNCSFKRPQIQHALDAGRFSGEDIERFIRMRYFQDSNKYNRITLVYPPNWMNCPFAIRLFAEGENTMLSFAQYFVNCSPTLGQMELLNLIEEKLGEYVNEQMKTGQREKKRLNETFLLDLINGIIENKEIITDRVAMLNIPYEANYKIYCISFEHYSHTLAYHTKNNCKSIFPYAKILIREQQIIILYIDYTKSKKNDTEAYSHEKLENLLDLCQAYCGISNPFTNLSHVRSGYLQSCAALRAQRYIHSDSRVVLFSDAVFADMLEQYVQTTKIDAQFLYNPKLDIIIKNDAQTGNDNLVLLESLLKNNRNITKTAKEMNLHRNSVIYRLERIEDMIDASLDDFSLRFQLIISLEMLKCIKEMPAITEIEATQIAQKEQ